MDSLLEETDLVLLPNEVSGTRINRSGTHSPDSYELATKCTWQVLEAPVYIDISSGPR